MRASANRAAQYVQYGCGWTAPAGWRNFDASPTLRFERLPVIGRLYTKNASRFPANVEYGDIVKGLPLGAGSCEAIYCSHVLEHLSLSDCRTALRNTLSLLRPGGTFRLVLPDLEHHIQAYVNREAPSAGIEFLKETMLGREARGRGFKSRLQDLLGNSAHLWMWDYKALHAELVATGFAEIRRAQFGDSSQPRFAEVEEAERWKDCLGIECIRPPE